MKTNKKLISAVACLSLLTATQALAGPNAGFSVTGFIQDANLTGGVSGLNTNAGGTITVNGKQMIVPTNSIVQMPASAWSWADLFDQTKWAPVYDPAIPAGLIPPAITTPLPAGSMGLALNDLPAVYHFPSFQVSAVGNITVNPRNTVSPQQYIVGLIVPAEQQGLNNHSGYINFIDYTTGRFRIGGPLGNANCVQGNQPVGGANCPGTIVEINDPIGRYGLIHSPDQRFQADTSNPTVTTATGYPVCIPRTSPGIDPFCPAFNRPLNPLATQPGYDPFIQPGNPLKSFTMPPVANVIAPGAPGGPTPDPRLMVPLMVGDWVDVSGTIFKLDPNRLAGGNAPANQYISAYSVTANLGVKTAPGTWPAYIRVEEFLFGVGDGVGGPTVLGGVPATPITQETSTRIQLVAFTTDADVDYFGANAKTTCTAPPDVHYPQVELYGVDASGGTWLFPDGTTLANAATGDMCMDDPIRGRIRWQAAKHPKPGVSGLLGNATLSPEKFHREYILKLTGATPTGGTRIAQALPASSAPAGMEPLIAGQYLMPIFEYLFAETTGFGQPTAPYNFNDFGFLFTGPNALTPFPDFK